MAHSRSCMVMKSAAAILIRRTLSRRRGMRPRLPHPIRLLLLSSVLLSLVHAATAQTSRPTFEVATVKLAPPQADPNTGSWSLPGIGRFTATHVPLALLLQLAYGVDNSQIANQPDWLETNLYDIVAKPEDGIQLTRDELKPRLQNLLHQRFHLVAHTETRLGRGYALVIAKGGPHLTPSKGITSLASALTSAPAKCAESTGPCPSWSSTLPLRPASPSSTRPASPGTTTSASATKPNPMPTAPSRHST